MPEGKGDYQGKKHKPSHDEPESRSKRNFLKAGAVLIGGGIVAGVLGKEFSSEPSFKESVTEFIWENAKDPEKIKNFNELIAKKYIEQTKSPTVTAEQLIKQTNYFYDSDEYLKAVRAANPEYFLTENWGYTHFATGEVFIDLKRREQEAVDAGILGEGSAGLAILGAAWHEWGHVDVEERTSGHFLNNDEFVFTSPVSGKNEVFKKYRGGEIFTDTYFGFLRFEEVWNESINVRRQLGLGFEKIISASNYYENGVDFFPLLTRALGISLEQEYELHRTSDFEGFARLIGLRLPGNEDPINKGVELFLGIHNADSNQIKNTGALSLIRK